MRAWAIVGLVCLVGCGGPARSYSATKVAGEVTLDDQPIAEGVINFISDQPGTSSGDDSAPIKDGKFTATKVPPGKVRVFIVATKATGKMISGSSEPVPEVISIIPPQYAQGIEVTIAGDETDRKFALKSKTP